MKAMTINRYGKNIPLKLTEMPTPQVEEYEVLVEIYAASINPIDFKIRDGKIKLLLNYNFPLILGNDFSGKVIKVGTRVSKFKIGDEVYGRPRKNRIGTFAEFIAIHEEDISLKPTNLTFEEAASIPLVGLTSYQAITDIMKLKKDQKILIHAGAGGVGTFAIQFAKELGAYVATTTSEKGNELVQNLGADLIINYKKENFDEIVKDYDAVFDTLGGITLEKSFGVLKPFGKIVSVSGLPDANYGRQSNAGVFKTMLFSIVSRKISTLSKQNKVAYHFLFMKPSGVQLNIIKQLIEENKIKPIVDRIYSLAETQAAIEYVETGRAKGKVIIKIK